MDWDEKLPDELAAKWQNFRTSLKDVEKVHIPRWIGTQKGVPFQLHGFADASNDAYASAIYYRVVTLQDQIKTGLLTSKARVAPIKGKQTIPRLELQAALLTAQLMDTVVTALGDRHITVKFWSDSTTVIHWINKSAHLFKDFVAHRVTEVQEISNKHHASWQYVNTIDNPADVASRGSDATDLLQNNLWWNGPNFLQLDETEWPKMPDSRESEASAYAEETKPRKVHVVTTNSSNSSISILEKFENISKVFLVTAFVLRFVKNIKAAAIKKKLSSNEEIQSPNKQNSVNLVKVAENSEPLNELLKKCPPISRMELIEAEEFLCKQAQASAYAEEISCLRKEKPLPRHSKLVSLAPFIDQNGLIRVGGRLRNAIIPFNVRHPIILPGDSLIAKKLIKMNHLTSLHGGVQMVTRELRQKYWLIGGRNAIRFELFKCTVSNQHPNKWLH